ncbi:adenosylhomocysteine nucleosidase [Alkalihalobacillus xiaoxiensis]|uniref:Adenosylhomocysteine nucleosidase n=1 Tax=Shouchella xiaoxiensis TaxID=766895 RepID=A0ABS2SQ72_9BACI|nr:HAD hydrolase-like protein [Shouchella xiaoxiensis]MBM7837316.1 adenosylhomocysteine nucleosidase [Shouchella xiaoxiensis]
MKPALIFDMDGTLFKTEKVLTLALVDTFNQLNEQQLWHGEAPVQSYLTMLGAPMKDVWQTLLPGAEPALRKQADHLFLVKIIEQIKADEGELYPDVPLTLQRLKEAGFSLYIASNGMMSYLKTILNHYQLNQWFTDYYGADRLPVSSKTELVHQLKQDHQLNEAYMIGDRKSDISAGAANRLHTVACTYGYGSMEELAQATMNISSFRDVIDIVAMPIESDDASTQ